MQSIDTHVLPHVRTEAAKLKERNPEHAELIDALTAEFAARFRENLMSYEDAFELCRKVEGMLSEHDIPAPLLEAINASRRKILADNVILHGFTHKSLAGDMPLKFHRQFDIARPKNGIGAKKEVRKKTEQELETIIREQNYDLLRMAASMGADAAADVLCAMGQIGEDERSKVISLISAYLGTCESFPEPGTYDFFSYPKAVTEVPSVRMVIDRLLLQANYARLLEEGADDRDASDYVRKRAPSITLEHMKALAKNANVTDPMIHASLFMRQSELFRKICSQPHPKNMVSTITEQGTDFPFPSLRQQVAVQLLRERKKLYVAFEPGKGKTAVPFYLMEQLREEGKSTRMLYLAPLPVVQELPNRVRPGSAPQKTRDCYYVDPAQAPTVGVISRKLKNGAMERAVHDNDVVFMPYTMLHSTRDLNDNGEDEKELDEEEKHLIDVLCEQDWDILVLDEGQSVDGNKKWTRFVDRLIHGKDGEGTHLSKKGYIIPMSGTPMMNTVADPVVIHDLFSPPHERNKRYGADIRDTIGRAMGMERGINPLRVRQALNQTLLTLDPPEQWLNNVDMVDYPLSEKEMEFLNAICSNPTLHATHKINVCMQFILCPKLISGDDAMPESLLEWTKWRLDYDLSQKNAVLIAENMRAEGVLRHAAQDGEDDEVTQEMELHFYQQIARHCEEWSATHDGMPVHFYTIHGDTPQARRQDAYRDAELARKAGTHKVVIFGFSSCFNVGIRLHVDRFISLEWPHNSPDIQQLIKRALREEESDVRLAACYAIGTLQQGMYEQSIMKYQDGLRCLYGASVSDAMLLSHIQEREKDSDGPQSEDKLFRLLGRSSLAHRRYEIGRWLHGRGTADIVQFWNRHREEFARYHEEADEFGTGDMQRFVAGLVRSMTRKEGHSNVSILDVNSNGLSLERELRRMGGNGRTLVSTDPLALMLERGRTAIHRDDPSNQNQPSCAEVSPTDIHRAAASFPVNKFDVAVLRNLEQCGHMQSDSTVHERARALMSVLRTLKLEENGGGRIVITLPRTACTNEEFEYFVTHTLELFGCLPVKGWYGAVSSEDNEGDEAFRGFCVVAEKMEDVDEQTLRSRLKADDLKFTHHGSWPKTAEGTRIGNALRKPKLPYPLRHAEFKFGNRTFVAAQKPEVREAQDAHLHAIRDAVNMIHALAPTAKEWKALPKARRRTLEKSGILLVDLSHVIDRPAFSLRAYPGHLFFPFDQQWTK